jgi:hypothetical protein
MSTEQEWILTRNATRVLFTQRISLDDVMLTIEQPEQTIAQQDDESDDVWVYIRGDLAVIVNAAEKVVITMMTRAHARPVEQSGPSLADVERGLS